MTATQDPEPPVRANHSFRRVAFRSIVRAACLPAIGLLLGTWLWNQLALPIESRIGAAGALVALLVSSFWIYAAFGAAAIGLLALLARQRRIGGLTLLVAACALAPFVWSLVRPLAAADAPDLTVLSANLCFSRANLDALAAEARHWNADVIVLQEVNDAIVPRLHSHFDQTHPHSVVRPRPDAFGEAVFSRYPLQPLIEAPEAVDDDMLLRDLPRIDVVLATEQGPVRLINVHTLPPISGSYIQAQDRMARDLARIAREADGPIIFAGDFNSPEMGVPVRRLLETGLHSVHAARGRGLGDTWPRTGPFRNLLRTRIDHILFSRDLECTATGAGADNGSDHRPVWASFKQQSQ